jgi:hypothetical protein
MIAHHYISDKNLKEYKRRISNNVSAEEQSLMRQEKRHVKRVSFAKELENIRWIDARNCDRGSISLEQSCWEDMFYIVMGFTCIPCLFST